MKIQAIVKSRSDQIFYVIDEIPDPISTKIKEKSIIQQYGDTLFNFLVYSYNPGAKAFAGTEFEIKLDDGSIEKCNGLWWDRFNKDITEELRCRGKEGEFTNVGISTVGRLTECYVYSGFYIFNSDLEKMVTDYTGLIYDYYQYEKEIIIPLKNEEREQCRIDMIERLIHCGFREKRKGVYESKDLIFKVEKTNFFFIESKKVSLPDDIKWIIDNIYGDDLESVVWLNSGRWYVNHKKYVFNFYVWRK